MVENLLEEKGVIEVASLLRYFIDSGEHGYAEKMKALDNENLNDFLLELLFEARKRRKENMRDDKGRFVPIPPEESVKDFIKIFKNNTEEAKKAVLLLSLSRKSFEKEEQA